MARYVQVIRQIPATVSDKVTMKYFLKNVQNNERNLFIYLILYLITVTMY